MNLIKKATVKALSHPSLTGIDLELGRRVASSPIRYSFHMLGNSRTQAARRVHPSSKYDASGETVREFQERGYAAKKTAYDPALISEIQRSFDTCIQDVSVSQARGNQGFQGSGEISRRILDPLKNVPRLAELIDEETRDVIEGYYGAYFTVFRAVLWRNHHVPSHEAKAAEAYSNWWHCDKRPTDISKLFVNLNNVEDDSGPFHILSRPHTQNLVRIGYRSRKDYGLPIEIIEDPAQMLKATGPAGTGLYCNTELCLHRADIPVEGKWRDIVQFQFKPADAPLPADWFKRVTN